MADPGEETTAETGCQLWGAIGKLLMHKPNTPREIDAIQRRLFAYPEYAQAHNITWDTIRDIRTTEGDIYFMGYLRTLINEYTAKELATMFY